MRVLTKAELSWEKSEDGGKGKSLKGSQVNGSKMVPRLLSKKLGIIAIFYRVAHQNPCRLLSLMIAYQENALTLICLSFSMQRYASVIAIESPSREDDKQWLAYWILYSFLTLTEMLLQPLLDWIPIWYSLKLLLTAWLVLPQFMGAAFIYERFVREHVRKITGGKDLSQPESPSPSGSGGKGKKKFVQFESPN
ncbi:hypothetical protein SADUNF_Sadunf19G0086200 [Salix dunnii]|uniref:HVA22-like protein n=1 Tax=Salix dunnii TaxID=1413687 RepID=A0A835J1Z2_9ROSI|nr:hypothetical protein SADUNF_Sadunf19G0086200 [Salix dunnii]